MRRYSPRELRSAIAVAILVTALATAALLDRSCQPGAGPPPKSRAHYP